MYSWQANRRFPQAEIQPIIECNRSTLRKVNSWISDETYDESLYGYGLPRALRHLIDNEIGQFVTYSDALAYFGTFLNKRVSYLELGVSVGKNFLQMLNFFSGGTLIGFDIEQINPVLEACLSPLGRQRWDTMPGSLKKEQSSLSEYLYVVKNNHVNYLSGDIFDEGSWSKLSGKKFNIILSDAFHSSEAILFEQTMIEKYDLLDEDEFVLVWDDMAGAMVKAFDLIWHNLQARYNLEAGDRFTVHMGGWLGMHRYQHRAGFILKLDRGIES